MVTRKGIELADHDPTERPERMRPHRSNRFKLGCLCRQAFKLARRQFSLSLCPSVCVCVCVCAQVIQWSRSSGTPYDHQKGNGPCTSWLTQIEWNNAATRSNKLSSTAYAPGFQTNKKSVSLSMCVCVCVSLSLSLSLYGEHDNALAAFEPNIEHQTMNRERGQCASRKP
jgi:hypothetical protein